MIEKLLEKLGVNEIDILAHDYGDSTAQEILARYESKEFAIKITTIAYLNSGFLPGFTPILMQKILPHKHFGPILTSFSSKQINSRSILSVFGKNKPEEEVLDDFWFVISHNDGHRKIHSLAGYNEERKHFFSRWISAMKKTSVPQIFIYGPSDPILGEIPSFYKREIMSANKRAYIAKLEEHVGHWPQLEAPESVFREYCRFLFEN